MIKQTQEQIVLRHLDKFGHINSLEAIRRYGITRISAVIYKIRNSGTPISATEDIPTASGFVTYRIDEEAMKQQEADIIVGKLEMAVESYGAYEIEFTEFTKRMTKLAIHANRLVNI